MQKVVQQVYGRRECMIHMYIYTLFTKTMRHVIPGLETRWVGLASTGICLPCSLPRWLLLATFRGRTLIWMDLWYDKWVIPMLVLRCLKELCYFSVLGPTWIKLPLLLWFCLWAEMNIHFRPLFIYLVYFSQIIET